MTLPRETFHDLGAAAVIDLIVARLGLPLYVKPSRGGSALGAGPVRSAAELPSAVLSCFAYGDTALIERFISGTEVAVGVIDLGQGPQALPAVEIVPGEGEYDYAARYTAGKTEFYVPARLDDGILAQVAEIAVAAHTVLGLRDLSRTDLIVDETRHGLVPGGQRGTGDDRDEHTAAGPGSLRPLVRAHLRGSARAGGCPRRLAADDRRGQAAGAGSGPHRAPHVSGADPPVLTMRQRDDVPCPSFLPHASADGQPRAAAIASCCTRPGRLGGDRADPGPGRRLLNGHGDLGSYSAHSLGLIRLHPSRAIPRESHTDADRHGCEDRDQPSVTARTIAP